MRTTAPVRDYTIESLDTGLRLLRLFLAHDTLTVSEAAERLDIGRSTAHRVLSTLAGRGFAVRESSGRGYTAGPSSLASPPRRFRGRRTRADRDRTRRRSTAHR
ncbi:helix-turn-helix domain-containing protein [Streptomyces sp. M10(2022)]